MKLIFGLLTLLCVARLAHCVPPDLTKQEAYNMKDQDPAYLTFSDGFKEPGTLVTFFYKYKANVQPKDGKVYINFYESELDEKVLKNGLVNNEYPEIIAHIAIQPNVPLTVKTNTFMKKGTQKAAWLDVGTSCCKTVIPVVGTGPNKDWWRVDIYKFDATHLGVFVQGKWFQNHEFKKPLNEIKSAYIFNLIDTNDVYIKYRIPSALVEGTPLTHFSKIVAETMKPLPDFSPKAPVAKRGAPLVAPPPFSTKSEPTSFKTVVIPKFEKNARIFITAWMGSREANQKDMMKPRIQIKQKSMKNKNAVFTIYHEWDKNKPRKSNIDVLRWSSTHGEMCTKGASDTEATNCEPVECGVGAETSDLEHYRIERNGDEIKVTTYYADADPIKGIMGKTCTTNTVQSAKLKGYEEDKDQAGNLIAYEIYGLNGAMILHVDIQ